MWCETYTAFNSISLLKLTIYALVTQSYLLQLIKITRFDTAIIQLYKANPRN